MMLRFACCLVFLSMATFGLASEPSLVPAELVKLASEGEQLKSGSPGEQERAIQKFNEASNGLGALLEKQPSDAEVRQLHDLQSQVQMSLGALYLANDKADEATLRQALTAFTKAQALGTERQKAVAKFNRGLVYLRLGKPNDAIDAIKGSDWKQIGETQQFLLNYNLGRAYTAAGNLNEAFDAFEQSLKLNAGFDPAADDAVETVVADFARDPQAASEMARRLVVVNRPRSAIQVCKRVLENGSDRPERLLGICFLAWARTFTSPGRFLEESMPLCQRFERAGCTNLTGDIQLVMSGELNVAVEAVHEAHPQLRWFGRKDAADLPGNPLPLRAAESRFLTTLAEWYATGELKRNPDDRNRLSPRARNPRAALATYIVGLQLDYSNTVAAYGFVSVLKTYGREVDPEGKVLKNAVDLLFHEKGRIYEEIYVRAPKSPQAWENLRGLHFLLGMILEDHPPLADGEGSPRSATFQFEHALTAERNMFQLGSRSHPAPGIHEHLADVYQKLKRPPDAFDERLAAAQGYLALDDRELARKNLETAAAVKFDPSPEQKGRFEKLRLQIGPPPPKVIRPNIIIKNK